MRLRERNDEAGIMTKKRIEDIIVTVDSLMAERKKILLERKKKVIEVKNSYSRRISNIEKDIIALENAGKLIAGANEYAYFKSQLKKDDSQEKEKEVVADEEELFENS